MFAGEGYGIILMWAFVSCRKKRQGFVWTLQKLHIFHALFMDLVLVPEIVCVLVSYRCRLRTEAGKNGCECCGRQQNCDLEMLSPLIHLYWAAASHESSFFYLLVLRLSSWSDLQAIIDGGDPGELCVLSCTTRRDRDGDSIAPRTASLLWWTTARARQKSCIFCWTMIHYNNNNNIWLWWTTSRVRQYSCT